MDSRQQFTEIMKKTMTMALATCADGKPNVRIVSFCYDEATPGTAYFTTDRDNDKIREFARNDAVAFTTIPADGLAHARVKTGSVKKSGKTLDAMKDLFISQIPSIAGRMEHMGAGMDVYEITFSEAVMVVGPQRAERLTF